MIRELETQYGNVIVRYSLFDYEKNVIEGITITSLEEQFEPMDIYNYVDVEVLTVEELEKIIQENI